MIKEYFKNIYNVDPDTNAYIIDISLDKYDDVFNEWDPAPFKKRDLDPDLDRFLEECSADIPMKYPLVLNFCLPANKYNSQNEEILKAGIKSYFQFYIDTIKKDSKKATGNILIYTLVSFVFLAIALVAERFLHASLLLSLWIQGLFIGGWVFLWEAFNVFFFYKRKIHAHYQTYKRFYSSDVRFKYI